MGIITRSFANLITATGPIAVPNDIVGQSQLKNDAVGQNQLENVVTMQILNSSGGVLKTIYGAGA